MHVVSELEVITALNELKILHVGCIDDIAIAYGKVLDGVFAFGWSGAISTSTTNQNVCPFVAIKLVVVRTATKSIVSVNRGMFPHSRLVARAQ